MKLPARIEKLCSYCQSSLSSALTHPSTRQFPARSDYMMVKDTMITKLVSSTLA